MLKKYLASVLNYVCYVSVAVCTLVCGGNANAAFDVGALQDDILAVVQEWLGVGLSVGFSIYIVLVGWRLVRRFVGGEASQGDF